MVLPLRKRTSRPFTPPPSGPSTEAWTISGLRGTTASASPSAPFSRAKVTEPFGGDGKPGVEVFTAGMPATPCGLTSCGTVGVGGCAAGVASPGA